MPRRKVAEKREVLPDPVYGSKLVTKFVNSMMAKGKRSPAERIFYGCMRLIEDRTKLDPQKLFKQAIDNVKPVLEVKSRRVGGATYQVPVDVRPDRALALGMRWLIHSARERSDGRTMREKLAAELLDASNNKGAAVKKREDTHKMAEANKAFAHYRW